MPVTVTVDMYSGLPNPSWELSDDEAARLQSLLASRKLGLQTSPGSLGRLGYRGLIVRSVGPAPAGVEMRAFDGVLESATLAAPNLIDNDSEVELFLLQSAGTSLRPEERQFIEEEIAKNVKGGPASSANEFELLAAPPYDAGKWNNDPHVRQNNNCYNYGNDKITNTFAQPGRASGYANPYPPTCPGTKEGAVLDGLVSIPSPDVTPAEGHVVALVVASSHPSFKDYHWYRRDNNGKWSHKPGSTAATNRDNAGRPIDDPRTCDRGFYNQFCGFFNAIPAKTRIR